MIWLRRGMAVSVRVGGLLMVMMIGLSGVTAIRGLLHRTKKVSMNQTSQSQRIKDSSHPEGAHSRIWLRRAIVGRRRIMVLRGIARGAGVWGIVGHCR